MRVAIFSIKNYERTLLDELNTGYRQKIVYFDTLLGPRTASLAAGFPAVSVFVNDVVDGDVLKRLATGGTQLVATRSTGFNHIDVGAAKELGVKVVRVANYSPNSVAEFAVGLAFFTREALGTILDTTLASIADFAAGRPLANEIRM